ncbi:MAG: hypothetical protein ABI867_24295 [Kofleriaceae bacterium]
MCSIASAEDAVDSIKPAVTRRGWQLDFTGYVQVDSIAWSDESIDELDPATSEPLNEQRFLIRRGRLRAEARREAVFGALEIDANTINGATARILGAQVGWSYVRPGTLPLVTVSAGLFKIPFGVEVPASERDKAFLEAPAFARALFPGNYDAGVMAQGAYGVARWSVAMMNGSPVADAQWRGADPAASYDFVARGGAVVEGPRKLRVEAGVSAITGTGLHPGTPATKDEIEWVDENMNGIIDNTTELRVIPGSPGTPSETFSRDAIGIDAQLHWCFCVVGNGTAFFEGVLATNLDRGVLYADPVTSGRDLRQAGFAAGVVQDFGRFVTAGVRYDRYNADRDAFEQQGIDVIGVARLFSTLGIMASAHWQGGRVLVQYDHQRNPFGRDDTGAPATRSSDRITLRAQVGF